MSTDPFSLENQKAPEKPTLNIELLNELQYILTDAVAGDPSALDNQALKGLNIAQIKEALDFILTNPDLNEEQKGDLLSNSWRLNYRDRPPTPEEFLTEKYLGPVAATIWPQVKQAFIDYLDPTKPYRTAVLYCFIGFGKAESNSELVYTPEGHKQIGDMKIGDLVCTPNGSVANVNGVFPQGVRPLYRLTFSDGRSVVADEEHLWKATKNGSTKPVWDKIKKVYVSQKASPAWKIVTTKQIVDSLKNNPKARWCIPYTQPVQHSKKSHIIPPYTMGALLGDGHFGAAISIVGDDPEIHSRIEGELYTGVHIKVTKTQSCNFMSTFTHSHFKDNPYKVELSRLQLRDSRSATKFIPQEYLYDSISNRVALLQGLMDTDGTAHNTSGMAIFCTTSSRLRDGMLELVRGLGGRASYSSYSKEKCVCANHDQYSIAISFPQNLFPIFSLKRKQERIDEGFSRPRKRSKNQYLYLSKIEKVEDGEATCITIDDTEHLFLTTGYITTHNSYLSVLVNMYIGVHLSMMKNPWKFFGHSPATVYTQVFCATSQKKSSELLFEPMLNMMEASPFFEKIHSREAMLRRDRDFSRMGNIDRIFWTTAVPTSAVQFSGGANFKLISSPGGLLGQTIVTGTMTELTFFYDAGKSDDFIFKFFSKLRARIESRMKGNYFGRFLLDSSPNTLESPIDDWVVHEASKNPTNYIIQGSRWKWVKDDFPKDCFDERGNVRPDKAFQVFVGGKGRPPAIIEPEVRDQYSPEDIIDVPNTFLMKGQFEENIYEALKDQAGVPAGSADKIFYDHYKVENVFDSRLKNIYTHIVASSKDPPEGLIWSQIKDQFFIKYINRYQFWYKPHIPRVFAVDQSISGDITSIAVAHLERRTVRVEGEDPIINLIYVVDLIVPITPSGGRINLDAIRFFLEDLRDKGSMNILYGSFDQFQSEATLQYLLRRGFEIEKLSVDKEMDAYLNFVSIIESGRLKAGRNLHLKNNLKSLQIVRRKDAEGKRTGSQKVDHSSGEIILEGNTVWEQSLIGIHAKDVSDTVCACCELLRKHDVLSYEEWEPEMIKTPSREDARKQVELLLAKQKRGVSIS